MKHGLKTLFGFVAGALLALGAGTAGADAVGPYYATPSWDQQLPASTRFVVLSNWVDADFPSGGAAVLDRETGLIWQRAPKDGFGPSDQSTASFNCSLSNTGGRGSWRLPSYQELASLFVYPGGGESGSLPAGHPFQNLQTGYYWTYTLSSAVSGWLIDNNGINARSPLNELGHSWCVRTGAPGALQQGG
jgi:uncharacterized protein DUF1566